jgi:signal transduction histidine kinase/CheY-like chemotaxis protein
MMWWQGIQRYLHRMALWRDYVQHMQPAADVPAEKHAQLLEMTHERLVYSFMAMPFVSVFAALFYTRHHLSWPMLIWALGYCAAYFFSRKRILQFQQDRERLPVEEFLAIWRKRLKRVAGLHGLALCGPLIFTANHPYFEFTTLWYLVMAAIVAGNATHQTPVLGIFIRFFNTSWNLGTVLAIVAYPKDWPFIMPMIMMFTFGIYRHALIAHQFFLQQVRLEDSGARLAAQFKQAKEVAETALAEKNQFLATASHDLRQPVHAMGMLIEALKQQNKDAALRPVLADLSGSLRSMSAMFNSLLDLSKIEAGVKQVNMQNVDIRAHVSDVVAQFSAEAVQRRLQLRVVLPSQAALAVCDVDLLRQIISNLLQNALRYTLRGGVLVALRSRGADWAVEVWDSGIGVAEETQRSIYLPFFRQEQAWHVNAAGHGLGLSVVARCAKLMDAPFGMQSRLGRGSRFWIQLRKSGMQVDAMAMQSDQPFRAKEVLPALNTGRCLIVEDDPQVTQAWRTLMQTWGIETAFATNSREAFTCLDAGFAPQVVFCDERLRAGESGFELLKAILKRVPQAHGIMVSGEFYSAALMQAEDEGYLVFRKPVDMGLIHDVLSRWLLPREQQPMPDTSA